MTSIIKPHPLRTGCAIAVIAPSSCFDRALFLDGVARLKSTGFQVVYRDDIFAQQGYLAGSNERRSTEFLQYLNDPSVTAIFCARGGYGAQRIVPHLDLKKIKSGPKWVVGYSDITVLLNLIRNELGWITLYGPTVAKHLGGSAPPENLEWLTKTLASTKPLGALPMRNAIVVKPGAAKGRVAGGCLKLVQTGIGTSYDVQTNGNILFLEDRGEKLYAIDRMLQQLRHAGKLQGVKGIVFGSMALPPQESDRQQELIPLLQEVLSDFGGPIVANFPSGHTDPFVPLPLGAMSTLSTDPLEWNITESVCA